MTDYKAKIEELKRKLKESDGRNPFWTIEVLREWLDEIGLGSSLIYFEKIRAENTNGDYPPKIIERAKRRLAALKGK